MAQDNDDFAVELDRRVSALAEAHQRVYEKLLAIGITADDMADILHVFPKAKRLEAHRKDKEDKDRDRDDCNERSRLADEADRLCKQRDAADLAEAEERGRSAEAKAKQDRDKQDADDMAEAEALRVRGIANAKAEADEKEAKEKAEAAAKKSVADAAVALPATVAEPVFTPVTQILTPVTSPVYTPVTQIITPVTAPTVNVVVNATAQAIAGTSTASAAASAAVTSVSSSTTTILTSTTTTSSASSSALSDLIARSKALLASLAPKV